MKEKIINAIGTKLDSLNIFIDDVNIVNENNQITLTIVLDSNEMIDLSKVVMATRIINPVLDKIDIIESAYTLDVYAKEKGEQSNE